MLLATVEFNPKGDGFVVLLHVMQHNNEPNCQGLPAKFVTEHFAHAMLVHMQAGSLS